MTDIGEQDVDLWLKGFQEIHKEFQATTERIEELESELKSAGISHISGVPRSQNYEHDSYAVKIDRLDILRGKAETLRQKCKSRLSAIYEALNGIHIGAWSDKRRVIELRYIDGLSWGDISFDLFGDKADYTEKEDSYLKRTFTIRKKAVEELSSYITANPSIFTIEGELICQQDRI